MSHEPLLDAEAIALLEATARDESEKTTVRLRALELLERYRRPGGSHSQPVVPAEGEVEGDPMGDLNDLERQRRVRERRAG
jgi:hypothetical protein